MIELTGGIADQNSREGELMALSEHSVVPQSIADAEPRLLADAPTWDREQFIPMRRATLVRMLADRRELSRSERDEFLQLAQALGQQLHAEFHERMEGLKCAYAPFDPDADTRTLEKWNAAEQEALEQQLFNSFRAVLSQANYRELTREEIEQAVDVFTEWGVRLAIDFSIFERLHVYARGDVVGRRERRRWRNFLRPEMVDVPIYQRLVIIFRLHEEKEFAEQVDASAVHIKLFKNIPKLDIDMLLPGSRIRMTWFDQGKIFVPTLSGVILTLAKILKTTLWLALTGTFWGVMAFLGCVVGTIGYGVRSFLGYLQTKDKYQLNLTRNLYYQNLDNNAGVIHRLLDEAEEQETREVLLAYYLLWKQAPREGWTETQLDRAAERLLYELTGVTVDFDCQDAVAKLHRLQLAERAGGRLVAIPLHRILNRLTAQP